MTRIDNAGSLRLSDVVSQLGLDKAHGSQELRSKGTDLYVKEGKAFFTSETSRANHRRDAIALVSTSLATEFHTTASEASRILTNVFGQAPTQITGSDVKHLNDLGKVASTLIGQGSNAVEAFDIAKRAETLEANGMDKATALSVAKQIQVEINKGMSESAATEGVMTARGVADGTLTPAQAKSQLTSKDARSAFMATLGNAMSALPEFSASSPAQKQTWLNIATTLGKDKFVPTDKVQKLPTDQKASLLQALSDHAIDRAKANDKPGLSAAYRSIIQFNKGITLGELVPGGEQTKLDSFLSKAGANPILRNARANWSEMTLPQRKEAIQTLIDLHAKEFGYVQPDRYLRFDDMQNPGVHGGLSQDGKKLTINIKSPGFNSFNDLFNTVIHESTHQHQHQLVEGLKSGRIDASSPLYNQARILAANETAGIFEDFLTTALTFPKTEAYDGYRGAPVEQHAFHVGDSAQAQIDTIFA